MSRGPTLDESDAMLLVAEELLAKARQSGVRLGLEGEATGLTVLQHAFAMAVSDAIGPNADRNRVIVVMQLAAKQVTDTIASVHATRHRRGRAGKVAPFSTLGEAVREVLRNAQAAQQARSQKRSPPPGGQS